MWGVTLMKSLLPRQVLLLASGWQGCRLRMRFEYNGAGSSGHNADRAAVGAAAWCGSAEVCVSHASGPDRSRRMGLEENGAPGGRAAAEAEPQLALRAPPAGARRWGPAQFAPVAPAAAPTAATPGARGLASVSSYCRLSCSACADMELRHALLKRILLGKQMQSLEGGF